MSKLYTLVLSLLLSLIAAPLMAADTEFQLNGNAIQAHADFLASDLLEGRATGARGYDLAAAYVATQFRQFGLKPVSGNGYMQRVPLVEATVVLPGSGMVFKHDNVIDSFEYSNDYLPAANFYTSPVNLTAPVAFAGYGITAPELDYDDFASVDVQGRIAIILEGAPKKFKPSLRDYYSWRDAKYANLIRHGAIAVVEIMRDEGGAESNAGEQSYSAWDRATSASWISDMRRVNADDEAVEPFAELKIKLRFNPDKASRLFINGHSWEQVLNAANAGTPQGFVLPGTMTLNTTTGLRRTESSNVVGVLTGADPDLRREYVLVMAHLDHLGRGAAVNGDNIYNGMQQNATGVAMMLELAREFAAMPQRPRRSILFVAATAGDRSAQGIQHLLKAGPIPVNNIVAAVSLDLPLPLMQTSDVLGIGADQSTLGVALSGVLQKMSLRLVFPESTEGSLTNNELLPFVQAGVPVVALRSGVHARAVRGDMRAARQEYLQNHFNQPSDDASNAAMDAEAAKELDMVAAQLMWSVANTATRPVWYRSSTLHNKLRR
ncbi:MAG TPA: M28 family peptidase [Steroidobacteraceae bacterium]|nr:M28 family peptidase [Steroidobacteraceae bacterium]